MEEFLVENGAVLISSVGVVLIATFGFALKERVMFIWLCDKYRKVASRLFYFLWSASLTLAFVTYVLGVKEVNIFKSSVAISILMVIGLLYNGYLHICVYFTNKKHVLTQEQQNIKSE